MKQDLEAKVTMDMVGKARMARIYGRISLVQSRKDKTLYMQRIL